MPPEFRIQDDTRLFAYDELIRFYNEAFKLKRTATRTYPGNIFTLKFVNNEFFVLRTRDKVNATKDQSTWEYTGDKVHVSVDSKQIKKPGTSCCRS